MNAVEPEEFKRLVEEIRNVEKAIGSRIDKDDKVRQLQRMKEIFEKSIVAKNKLMKGHVMTLADLSFKKPGTGIPASLYLDLLGKTLTKSVNKDYVFQIKDFI
jgi:sialic acid synthase SpsE